MQNLILELFNAGGEPSLINISNAWTIDPGQPDENGNESIRIWWNEKECTTAFGISFDQLKELIVPSFDAEFSSCR